MNPYTQSSDVDDTATLTRVKNALSQATKASIDDFNESTSAGILFQTASTPQKSARTNADDVVTKQNDYTNKITARLRQR